ncbi:hypothetical protein, partial [Paraburkholderia steynii]|uniref:hypothetical protein n=1 Tax=Paraburkholderia steynii TaxID=1245441 RepID=UPI001ABD9D62
MSRDAVVWWDVAVGLVFLSATLGGSLCFALASLFAFRASCVAVRCFGFCAGIRDLPSLFMCCPGDFCLFAGIRALLACFKRRPCAGRHLLFFAAAKKSRQKKAANT